MGRCLTVPITLTNLGDGAVNWEIFEKDKGFTPVAGQRASVAPKPSGPAVNLQGSSSPDVRFQPMESRIDALSILHITTTDTSLSIQRALNELGYSYDLFTGDNWTGIDFSPYDVVIIGMDGGATEAPSLAKLRTDVIDQGKRLIFMGGTCWQGFANGVNQYLVLNDTANYCWQVTNPPQWTVVDPSHPLADGLPLTYNYANFYRRLLPLRTTDPDLEVVSVNGEGYSDFFYKSSNFPAATPEAATGDLVWFINSAYSYYWDQQADFDVLKQIIFNSVDFSGADVPWLSESPVSGTIPGAAPLINLGHDFKAVDAGQNSNAVPSKPITISSPATAPDYRPAAPADPDLILWDQPLSVIDPNAYVDQEFPDFPDFSAFLADDFTATNPWLINSFFVPGGLWDIATDLNNATSLTWQIYADAAGVPAGDPAGGGSPPLWSLTLAPSDPMVTITNGSGGMPSDTTLTLSSPLYLPAGTYWFVFYPTAEFTTFGQYGRQAADTTNGYVGQFINPGGGFGFGTAWQDWAVIGALQQDLAFRIDGTVAVGTDQLIDVTFDATAIGQPGDYMADLKIKNDTPYGDLTVPVTMTVAPPADWGKLEGTVSSLGYCDAEHNPLEEAVVVVESSLGVTYTLATDVNGYYSWWLDSDGNDYTVSVTYPGHEDGLATGVVIVGGGTTTVNFDLRWLKPCMSVDPTSLSATLDFGQMVTQTIDLTNDGAAGTDFEIGEQDQGYTPSVFRGAHDVFSSAGPIGPASMRSMAGQAATASSPLVPNAWVSASPIPQGLVRYAHAQCEDEPDSFYLISGVSNFNVVSNTFRYDAATDTWTELAPLPMGQEGPTAACYQGYIFVMGGGGTNQFYIYEIATDTWFNGPALPRNVAMGHAGAFEGKIYLVGGDDDFFPGSGLSAAVDIYDIAAGTWSSGTDMPTAVSNAGYTQIGQYLYIVGGWWQASPGSNSGPELSATTCRRTHGKLAQPTQPLLPTRLWLPLRLACMPWVATRMEAATNSSTPVDIYDWNAWPAGAWADTGDPLPTGLTANNAGFCTNAVTGGEVWSDGGVDISFVWHADNQYKSAEACATGGGDVPWLREDPTTGYLGAGRRCSDGGRGLRRQLRRPAG